MLPLCLGFLVSACGGGDSQYDRGYHDGAAVGYNMACLSYEGNLTHDDWGSADYSRGYAEGMEDGIKECRKEQEN